MTPQCALFNSAIDLQRAYVHFICLWVRHKISHTHSKRIKIQDERSEKTTFGEGDDLRTCQRHALFKKNAPSHIVMQVFYFSHPYITLKILIPHVQQSSYKMSRQSTVTPAKQDKNKNVYFQFPVSKRLLDFTVYIIKLGVQSTFGKVPERS